MGSITITSAAAVFLLVSVVVSLTIGALLAHADAEPVRETRSRRRRSARPERVPRCTRSVTTRAPLTQTPTIPSGDCRGSSKVPRSTTVAGSNSTRSATAPGRMTPRSTNPNTSAGRPVIRCTASSNPRTPRSLT